MKEVKKKLPFPEGKKFSKIRDKLSNPKFHGGNISLPENPKKVELAKYQACQMIAKYQREHGLLQKDLASRLGINESRVSDILRGNIESFTLDRIVGYAEDLYPDLKISISAA